MMPPVACKLVFVYATFSAPLGTAAVVMPRIEKLYGCVAVKLVGFVLSVTVAVKLNEPDTVGVPLMAPPELIVIPVGNAPALIVQV